MVDEHDNAKIQNGSKDTSGSKGSDKENSSIRHNKTSSNEQGINSIPDSRT